MPIQLNIYWEEYLHSFGIPKSSTDNKIFIFELCDQFAHSKIPQNNNVIKDPGLTLQPKEKPLSFMSENVLLLLSIVHDKTLF